MNDRNDKKKMVRTIARVGVAVLVFTALASAQERVVASPVFGGNMMYRTSMSSSNAFAVPAASSSASAVLPNAPSAILRGTYAGVANGGAAQNSHLLVAPIYAKYIPAGWTAQPLTGRDKVILGLRDTVAPFSILSIVVTTAYSQALNGQPNYGTNGRAFGKRLGAAAIRDTTEGIFTDSVFAPLLHEDPRYYVEGNRHGFVHRLLYAATRPIITRTDSGHETLNTALLLGYASASALSYTYYPAINQNFHDTAATFGGGIGATAVGDIVSEFSDDVLIKLHLKRAR